MTREVADVIRSPGKWNLQGPRPNAADTWNMPGLGSSLWSFPQSDDRAEEQTLNRRTFLGPWSLASSPRCSRPSPAGGQNVADRLPVTYRRSSSNRRGLWELDEGLWLSGRPECSIWAAVHSGGT